MKVARSGILNYMERRLILFAFLLPLTIFAQSNFVEKVRETKEGWGKVDIVQDSRLTKLVNNDTIIEKKQKKNKANHINPKSNRSQKNGYAYNIITDSSDASAKSTPAKIRRYKVNGYRVQIYAGSNSRSSRKDAEKTAHRFKGFFPKVPVYTHFYPPRWVCRAGDFRTEEQAVAFMHKIKQLKIFSGVIVVKTAVLVSYRSEVEE